MMRATLWLATGIVCSFVGLAGCGDGDETETGAKPTNDKKERAITERAATEPDAGTFHASQGFPRTPRGGECTYPGGCEGTAIRGAAAGVIHPTSTMVQIDGKSCSVEPGAVRMDMDPSGWAPGGWRLEAAACGMVLVVAGDHVEWYPQSHPYGFGHEPLVSLSDGDTVFTTAEPGGSGTLSHGPSNHRPRAIEGRATVSDGTAHHAVELHFYFADAPARRRSGPLTSTSTGDDG